MKPADGSFSVNKYYTRGLELISVDISDDAKKEYTKKTYIQDGHGSVTALLENKDNKNSITDTYCYDAYGNLLQKTGDTENDYLYTGEQYHLLMAGETTILNLTIAMAKGLIVQTLITCTATALFGELAASILKVVGIAQDTIGFVAGGMTNLPWW